MIKESVTIDDVIKYLNELVDLDRDCISRLMLKYEKCNNGIVNHPTCQATKDGYVSLLGLINGIFGVIEDGSLKDYGMITAVLDDEANLSVDPIMYFERTE